MQNVDQVGMTLDQRSVMLATAVSIDFDYFSRHSQGSGGFFPFFWWGGEAAETGAAGGAVGGAAGGVGAVEAGAGAMSETGAGAIGQAAKGVGGAMGAGEGAVAGAGTMAGYEAMQRARERMNEGGDDDDASPTASEPFGVQKNQSPGQQNSQEDVWGEQSDPWSGGSGQGGSGPGFGEGSSGGGGGGGSGSWFEDFFGSS